ncbi:hypothetical protein KAU33_12110 [Candidatus Dependentiae bacterium]|nr:hypothetical protein [Candidatus Dependentiae bacterium]
MKHNIKKFDPEKMQEQKDEMERYVHRRIEKIMRILFYVFLLIELGLCTGFHLFGNINFVTWFLGLLLGFILLLILTGLIKMFVSNKLKD